MEGHAWIDWICYLAGATIVALFLLDIFLTVLYARSGAGFATHRLCPLLWRLARWLAIIIPRFRDSILAFAGPLMLVAMVLMWFCGLLVGFALILWPGLGTSIGSPTQKTPHDFITAIYLAGNSMTTVGAGDTAPRTPATKIVVTIASGTGFAVMTLVITYLMQVYTALLRRNALTLELNHGTGGSGDAAELLAGLGGGGTFSGARTALAELGSSLVNLYEAHHFYSVLLYFRFQETQYAIARAAEVVMDIPSLIWSALDEDRCASVRECIGTREIWDAGMKLLGELERVFLPKRLQEMSREITDAQRQRWTARYRNAVARLRAAGIAVTPDDQQGARSYVELRRQWDTYVTEFAAYMLEDIARVDPPARQPAREKTTPGALAPGSPGRGGALASDDDDDEQEALSRI